MDTVHKVDDKVFLHWYLHSVAIEYLEEHAQLIEYGGVWCGYVRIAIVCGGQMIVENGRHRYGGRARLVD